MRVSEAGAQLLNQLQFALESGWRVTSNHVRERSAVDILHCNEGTVVVFADVVNGDDVGVAKSGCGACLPCEAFTQVRVGVMNAKDFDGDRPLEQRITREVDDAHAAGAEPIDHLVSADCRG